MYAFLSFSGEQYFIVKLPEEDHSAAIVPASWLTGKECLWPPDLKNITHLVKTMDVPGDERSPLPCVHSSSVTYTFIHEVITNTIKI